MDRISVIALMAQWLSDLGAFDENDTIRNGYWVGATCRSLVGFARLDLPSKLCMRPSAASTATRVTEAISDQTEETSRPRLLQLRAARSLSTRA